MLSNLIFDRQSLIEKIFLQRPVLSKILIGLLNFILTNIINVIYFFQVIMNIKKCIALQIKRIIYKIN